MSGGEQQMCAMARADGRAGLLMIDEMSLGLAPVIVDQLLECSRNPRGRRHGLAGRAGRLCGLHVADRGYVMETGRIVRAGTRGGARRSGGAARLSGTLILGANRKHLCKRARSAAKIIRQLIDAPRNGSSSLALIK